MSTATPPPAIQLPLIRDPGLLPPLEMDGYLTGILVTPHLETSQWVMGLWRERPAADMARIEQGLATALAHRKTIEASFAKGWPGFLPGFCETGRKPVHGKVRIWARGFWSAVKLAPDYWSAMAEGEPPRSPPCSPASWTSASRSKSAKTPTKSATSTPRSYPRALVGKRKLALIREDRKPALRAVQTGQTGRNEQCPCGSGKKYKRCCAVA